MSKTKTETGLQALQALKAVDGDATPEPNDTTVIEEAYDQIKASLYNRHLVSWDDTAVPDDVINPLVYLIAESRLTVFSPPMDVQQFIMTKANSAVEDITEALSLDYVHEPIPSESF